MVTIPSGLPKMFIIGFKINILLLAKRVYFTPYVLFFFCGMMVKGGRLQIRLPEAVARGSTDEPN